MRFAKCCYVESKTSTANYFKKKMDLEYSLRTEGRKMLRTRTGTKFLITINGDLSTLYDCVSVIDGILISAE